MCVLLMLMGSVVDAVLKSAVGGARAGGVEGSEEGGVAVRLGARV